MQGEWTGDDQLGQILETVREKLKIKYPSLPLADPITTPDSVQDGDIDDLTPMPEEAIIEMPIQSSQSTQPSPRAKPMTGDQSNVPATAPISTDSQQIPVNKSKGRNKGGKKVQITGNQPGTSSQATESAQTQAHSQTPALPPRGNRRTRAKIGQGSEL